MHYFLNQKIHHHANLIHLLKAELNMLPEGSMKSNKKNYYQAIQGKETNITKNKTLIAQYCRKRFIIALLKHLEKNHILPAHQNTTRTAKAIINSLPNSYQNFPLHYYFHMEYNAWITAKSKPNNLYSKDLKYPTKNHNLVRSKSELIIANHLENQKIPSLYEHPLKIKNKTIYPDFTIICPYTSELKIWEHFGLLNDPLYEKQMKDKIVLYHQLGFKLFKNIIYTFESDISDPDRIQKLIEEIILNPEF